MDEIAEYIELAELHSRFDRNLANKVLEQDASLVIAKATPESRKLYNQYREVLGDFHRIRSFMRLKISKRGALYASIDSKHRVEEMILNHFVNRFPLFWIVIETDRGCFIGKKGKETSRTNERLETVLERIKTNTPESELLTDIPDFNTANWNTYYKSQYIAERKNIRLFRKQFPKKFHSLAEVEGSALSKKISDF